MPATRRAFLESAGAASYARIRGANDRIGVGFIGCGLIGLRHIEDFKTFSDAALAAVSDTYQPRIDYARTQCGSDPKGYADFRRLLDDKAVDAVVISTPDHWHALQTVMACAAGKDVYVEKPMTLFIREGRWMIQAAAKYNRVVCVGTQARSNTHMPAVFELMRSGVPGRVHSVRFSAYRNVMPGFGRPSDAAPPPGLDYDMWLGPAPRRPFNPNRCLYHFRWFWDYSGGQMTNLGAHDMDIVHYILGLRAPKSVFAAGGRFALQDNGETPDTQDAVWDYGGIVVEGSFREAGGSRRAAGGTASSLAGVQFIGTQGILAVSRGGYEYLPDMRIVPESAIPQWSKPPGHPPAAAENPRPYGEPRKGRGAVPEPIDLHSRHFLDCIKTRKRPVANVEDGHQVAIACHLANLSMRLGRKLVWDADNERVANDSEANALLERPYRKPWDAVLRSLLS